MRFRSSFLMAFILVLSASAAAQQQPQRDPQAVAVLTSVVQSMGAGGFGAKPPAVIAQGALTAGTGGISGKTVWKTSANEFRYERPGPSGPIVFVSGHGNPAIVNGAKIRRGTIGHLAMNLVPPHLPALVLASHLANQRIQISKVQQVMADGASALKISTADLTDQVSSEICKQDWYFDAASLLPLRVDFWVSEASNALDLAKMSYIFSKYAAVSSVLVPFHVTALFNGQQIEDISFDSIQLGAAIAPIDFDPPSTASGGAR